MEEIARLQPFVGEWTIEASLAPDARGRAVFEWALGGAYLLERSEAPDPAPDGICVIAAQGDGYMQHYFDSRGVTRLYSMTFDGREWTLLREQADFSPLDFSQRWVATFSDDGSRIDGRWEIDHGGGYEVDFEMSYIRARS